jgi:hypothetical protein
MPFVDVCQLKRLSVTERIHAHFLPLPQHSVRTKKVTCGGEPFASRSFRLTRFWTMQVLLLIMLVLVATFTLVRGQNQVPSKEEPTPTGAVQSKEWPLPNSWKRSGILNAGVNGSYDGAVGDDNKVCLQCLSLLSLFPRTAKEILVVPFYRRTTRKM